MKIEIRVRPGAGKTEVEKQADGRFLVRVKERPAEGKANEAVVEALGRHFGIPKRSISIVHGMKSRDKIIEIL